MITKTPVAATGAISHVLKRLWLQPETCFRPPNFAWRQQTSQHRCPKINFLFPKALSRDPNHHLTYPIQDSRSLKHIIGGPKKHISASVALIVSFPRAWALKRVFGTRKHVLGPQPWFGTVQNHYIRASKTFVAAARAISRVLKQL